MKTKILLLIFWGICLILVQNAFGQADMFLKKVHHNPSISDLDVSYRLFVPENYDTAQKYPLVMFFHGAGAQGSDNEVPLNSNFGALLWATDSIQAKHPCFVLVPQCPSNNQWVNTPWSLGSYNSTTIPVSKPMLMVVDIIKDLKSSYSLDTSSLFVTGLSMGGYGCWDIILRYPGMFRAAIPICGAGDPAQAKLLATTPIWCFHSSDDGVVPVKGSRDMVNAINGQGVNNRDHFYTEYTDQGHGAWTAAYNTPELVSWLFNTVPVQYTPDVTPPEPPTGIYLDIKTTEVRINWQNTAPDKYYNKIYMNGDFKVSVYNQTYKRVTGLMSGTSYTFSVSTVDWVGNESLNNPTFDAITLGQVGISENVEVEDKLQISPNPANEIIHIRGLKKNTEATVMIFSSNGIMVLQESFTLLPEKLSVNVAGYSPGVYQVVVQNADKTIDRAKFVFVR